MKIGRVSHFLSTPDRKYTLVLTLPFTEYIMVPEEAVKQGNILSMLDNLSFVEAFLAEPLSHCINGQEYLELIIHKFPLEEAEKEIKTVKEGKALKPVVVME